MQREANEREVSCSASLTYFTFSMLVSKNSFCHKSKGKFPLLQKISCSLCSKFVLSSILTDKLQRSEKAGGYSLGETVNAGGGGEFPLWRLFFPLVMERSFTLGV